MSLGDREKEQLATEGYLVLEDFMSADLRASLIARVEELFREEGDAAGSEFKQEPGCGRLANLVDKGEVFRRIIVMPEILEAVGCVLGSEFKLSSLNARSANPRSNSRQPLHADMGAVPDERGYWVCNSVWMLDGFTTENGAIRMIPGSHRWGGLPQDALEDPLAPDPREILLTGTAGTVAIMNAHMWHGATENRTDRPRRALHAFYARRDKPQQQYQKQLVRPEVQARLTPEQREILALDDPLNDEVSREVERRSGFLK